MSFSLPRNIISQQLSDFKEKGYQQSKSDYTGNQWHMTLVSVVPKQVCHSPYQAISEVHSGQGENKRGPIKSKVTLWWPLWKCLVLLTKMWKVCKQGRCWKFDKDLHHVITIYHQEWFVFCCRRSSEPAKFLVFGLRFRGSKNQKNQF